MAPPGLARWAFGTTIPKLMPRLYGVALLALLLVYAKALHDAQNGLVDPTLLWVGLVSNGGAAICLVSHPLRPPMRAMPLLFGGIAAGVAACLVWPQTAIAPLW